MTGSLPLPVLPEGAELVRHVEFVRRLARGLAADGASADDLAQETWLATLERPGGPSGSLRAWLARVLRNRAALALRRGERRARRESAREAAEESAPTAELVERMELHGRVVAAVLALAEEQREVVVRHYFAGESTHVIAGQLGVPEATVRTRLTRAHERLRRRLESHFGGSRALALAALSELAREGAPVPSMIPGPATLALTLAMKKTLAVLVVTLLALLAVWMRTREETRGAPAAALPGEAEVAAAPRIEATPVPAAVVEREVLAPAPAAEPPTRAARPVVEETVAPAAEAVAESKEAWLEFHVRDSRGFPVPDAKVRIDCYRTREEPGSSTSLGDHMPSGTTDADGIARLEYPRHLDAWDGPERHTIGEVCYAVEHPDFVTVNEWEFDVDKSPAEVVLRHGALLIVSGYLGERSALVTDVVPHLSDEARVRSSDWSPTKDGRPSCSRLPGGRHALYLTRAGEGGTWASEAVEFELGEEEVKELALALHPPRTLRGRLDPLVPRPVQNGAVELCVYLGTPGNRQGPRGLRVFRADVHEDGSFEIPGLPPGAGEMIGMCDGWVSREIEPHEEDAGKPSTALRLQQVDAGAGEFVLTMERTARLEVLVLDPDGEPVEGAELHMWPNVHWSIGYSSIFLDREWNAVTDASGHAEIENLLPGDESVALTHADLCLPVVDGSKNRHARAALVSGETTALELRLVPRE